VSTYELRISAGRPSDLGHFTSRYEARRFLKFSPWEPWKPASGNRLGMRDRERTEHGAELVRLDAPRIHANLLYELTKVRLAPAEHG